jgi:hypothetical protein
MYLNEIVKVNPNKFWYYIHKGQFINEKTLKYVNKADNLFDVGAGSGNYDSNFPLVWLIRRTKGSKSTQSDLKQSSIKVNYLISTYSKIKKFLTFNEVLGTSIFIVAKKN